MDFRLLLPLAVLSIVGFISFFVERSAVEREVKLAAAAEDKLDATLRLLNRDVRDVSIGGGQVFIPFVILTLLGSVPNWVIWGAWLFVFCTIVRIPLVHFSRGRDAGNSKKATILFFPVLPIVLLSVPLIIVLYIYTLVAVVQAL